MRSLDLLEELFEGMVKEAATLKLKWRRLPEVFDKLIADLENAAPGLRHRQLTAKRFYDALYKGNNVLARKPALKLLSLIRSPRVAASKTLQRELAERGITPKTIEYLERFTNEWRNAIPLGPIPAAEKAVAEAVKAPTAAEIVRAPAFAAGPEVAADIAAAKAARRAAAEEGVIAQSGIKIRAGRAGGAPHIEPSGAAKQVAQEAAKRGIPIWLLLGGGLGTAGLGAGGAYYARRHRARRR